MGNGYRYSHKKPEARSHDRVHFTVLNCYLMKVSIRDCLVETMGLSMSQLSAMSKTEQNLHVICRPSQFARFIILRHVKYNEPNNMACLHMRLVLPPQEGEVTDVSANPNTAGHTDSDVSQSVRRCDT